MASYVLVHGSWHGGWCWRRVAKRLRAKGHEVFTPTLTGLGERCHLLAPSNDVNLHVEDVVNVLRFEDLQGVVLCGHSYGGMVITGVASQVPERVRALVYLDAYLPGDGQSMVDLRPPIRLGPGAVARRVYVRAEEYPLASFENLWAMAAQDPSWETSRVPGGHDLMVDSPDEVAAILLRQA